jgi:hypothetical protein
MAIAIETIVMVRTMASLDIDMVRPPESKVGLESHTAIFKSAKLRKVLNVIGCDPEVWVLDYKSRFYSGLFRGNIK